MMCDENCIKISLWGGYNKLDWGDNSEKCGFGQKLNENERNYGIFFVESIFQKFKIHSKLKCLIQIEISEMTPTRTTTGNFHLSIFLAFR